MRSKNGDEASEVEAQTPHKQKRAELGSNVPLICFGSSSARQRSAMLVKTPRTGRVLTARQLVSGRTRFVFEPFFHQFGQALEIFAQIGIVADPAQFAEDGLVVLPG
jgi:hypothetical protein